MTPSAPLLLATDMDGTVIPLDQEPGRAEEITAFREAVESHPALVLAYVTGRHFELALQGQQEHLLPVPHLLVCDVGTSVYQRGEDSEWTLDEAYRDQMRSQLGDQSGDAIDQVLGEIPGLAPQEDEKQSEFKRSYYLPEPAGKGPILAGVEGALAAQGLQAGLVFSVDPVEQVGLLDVLPRGAAKDTALRYLQRKLGLTMDQVVYAGDSGNDLLAFTSGYKAIVVGNTPQAVRDETKQIIETRKHLAGVVYFAQRRYAGGVMEGARHFGAF